MINSIGTPPNGRLNSTRSAVAPVTSVTNAPSALPDAEITGPTIAADMVVALGPPVDMKKIEAIRTAIAEGRYNVDPQAIAAKMVDQDIPEQS
ncbi:MAG TPA: flagellar biosynthesis anti-sigma factor FlgM [Sphingomonas sp.]|jgi:negative regulator of flagellin synthesis FlgM|uniref:flagellar biosynthesis anti-sigma factor FlgM n=1 Tax=Sphingomonas sp. TaxID=28214 RepID=UPI002ED8DEE1